MVNLFGFTVALPAQLTSTDLECAGVAEAAGAMASVVPAAHIAIAAASVRERRIVTVVLLPYLRLGLSPRTHRSGARLPRLLNN